MDGTVQQFATCVSSADEATKKAKAAIDTVSDIISSSSEKVDTSSMNINTTITTLDSELTSFKSQISSLNTAVSDTDTKAKITTDSLHTATQATESFLSTGSRLSDVLNDVASKAERVCMDLTNLGGNISNSQENISALNHAVMSMLNLSSTVRSAIDEFETTMTAVGGAVQSATHSIQLISELNDSVTSMTDLNSAVRSAIEECKRSMSAAGTTVRSAAQTIQSSTSTAKPAAEALKRELSPLALAVQESYNNSTNALREFSSQMTESSVDFGTFSQKWRGDLNECFDQLDEGLKDLDTWIEQSGKEVSIFRDEVDATKLKIEESLDVMKRMKGLEQASKSAEAQTSQPPKRPPRDSRESDVPPESGPKRTRPLMPPPVPPKSVRPTQAESQSQSSVDTSATLSAGPSSSQTRIVSTPTLLIPRSSSPPIPSSSAITLSPSRVNPLILDAFRQEEQLDPSSSATPPLFKLPPPVPSTGSGKLPARPLYPPPLSAIRPSISSAGPSSIFPSSSIPPSIPSNPSPSHSITARSTGATHVSLPAAAVQSPVPPAPSPAIADPSTVATAIPSVAPAAPSQSSPQASPPQGSPQWRNVLLHRNTSKSTGSIQKEVSVTEYAFHEEAFRERMLPSNVPTYKANFNAKRDLQMGLATAEESL